MAASAFSGLRNLSLIRNHSSQILHRYFDLNHLSLFSSLSEYSLKTVTKDSKSPQDQEQRVSDFLIGELGFSDSQVSALKKSSPRLFKSTNHTLDRALEVLQILRQHGFTDANLRRLTSKCWSVFRINSDEELKQRLGYMKNLGFKDADIGRIVAREPWIMSTKGMDSTIENLSSVFGGSHNLMRIASMHPKLLQMKPEKVHNQVRLLSEECGLKGNLVLAIIHKYPPILLCTPKNMRMHIEYFKRFYDNPDIVTSRSFCHLVALSMRCSVAKIHEKMQCLETLGFTREQVKEMILKFPLFMSLSSHKTEKVTNILVDNGATVDALVNRPFVFSFSLEKRIIPRVEAFKFLNKIGQSGKVPSLIDFVTMAETRFLKRFLSNNPCGKKLLEIYNSALKKSVLNEK